MAREPTECYTPATASFSANAPVSEPLATSLGCWPELRTVGYLDARLSSDALRGPLVWVARNYDHVRAWSTAGPNTVGDLFTISKAENSLKSSYSLDDLGIAAPFGYEAWV